MPDRAVIFDLDGTLVDTAPDLMRATNHVLAGLGRRPISMDEVRAFVGHGARALLTRGLKATGGLPENYNVEPDYERFVAFYSRNIAQDSAAFPGLVALLERLQREGFALGVCTNKLEGLSNQLLEALDLSRFFGAVVGPDTLGVAKPDPRPFLETVSRLGLAEPQAVMVGDSETDILTARNAGVPVIAVPFGYTPRPVAEFAPDMMITHYDEAYEAIVSLLPPRP
ncbi:phosphoglycolate phosphatase [Aestuariivirga sp.]|uniref:phosphoglycolate phosphatase n=1 Tax=Aestuariivirga sp. TaxID=2650926 RepID=UPI0037849DE4